MEHPPKVFISYSQDNPEHSDWVLNFATKLRYLGIDVTCDIWDLNIGDDLLFFMNNGLNNVNMVICICSEKYVEKANNMVGGAGYETMLLSSSFLKQGNLNYIIPVIINNPSNNKVPLFLSTKIYIDFSNPLEYDKNMKKLIFKLYGRDERLKPPLGKSPFMDEKANDVDILNAIRKTMYQNAAMKGVVSFDYLQNSGVYTIGSGKFAFETEWSSCSNEVIYTYSDKLLAIGYNSEIKEIQPIDNMDMFDFTSRTRKLKIGDILILENKYHNFAILKILSITYDKLVSFEYQILDTVN